jgi:hypothetical protein
MLSIKQKQIELPLFSSISNFISSTLFTYSAIFTLYLKKLTLKTVKPYFYDRIPLDWSFLIFTTGRENHWKIARLENCALGRFIQNKHLAIFQLDVPSVFLHLTIFLSPFNLLDHSDFSHNFNDPVEEQFLKCRNTKIFS